MFQSTVLAINKWYYKNIKSKTDKGGGGGLFLSFISFTFYIFVI
jgi:hypothetical protein